jgi:DNA helicase II / ATP-dependent DNA helicase PcrA
LLRGAARSADAEDAGASLVATVRHVLSSAGFTEKPPEGGGAARERWESLAALVQLAETMATAGSRPAADPPAAGAGPGADADMGAGPTLADFAAELEERAAAQYAPALQGVTLASFHAAKGLEWDAVFLAGLVEGTMPIIYAETPDQVEEERRLLYVGVTRARERLFLSWALARSPGGRRGRRRSRFLDGIAPQTATPPRRERGSGRPRSGPLPCRVCGRPLIASLERKLGRCEGCPVDVDEMLLAELKAWRLETCREQSVPAFVIFTDATLQAIAEYRPTSEAELAKISGVGRAKLERYGDAVLALCRGESSPAPPTLLD